MSPDVFVAPNAAVIGAVTLQHRASVMYGAVVRGDLNDVTIGAFTSVGDRAVITTTKSVEGHVSAGVRIGNHVAIGPGALLQSCTIEDGAVIGARPAYVRSTHRPMCVRQPAIARTAQVPVPSCWRARSWRATRGWRTALSCTRGAASRAGSCGAVSATAAEHAARYCTIAAHPV